MGSSVSQKSVSITLPAEGILFSFLVLGDDMFPHSAFTFAGRFTVVHSCFITYDSLVSEKPLLHDITVKLHACFHSYLFVFIFKLLWHTPCANFAVPKVVMDDGICISIADVQLLSYISDIIKLFS
jgi:hypothetical protein